MGNRNPARRFDEIEQCLAALLLDDLTDELSETPYIALERLVFLGKLDIRTADGL